MKKIKIKFDDLQEFIKEEKRIEEFNASSILEGDDDLPEVDNSYFNIKQVASSLTTAEYLQNWFGDIQELLTNGAHRRQWAGGYLLQIE